jgi:hypothetical protein
MQIQTARYYRTIDALVRQTLSNIDTRTHTYRVYPLSGMLRVDTGLVGMPDGSITPMPMSELWVDMNGTLYRVSDHGVNVQIEVITR